MPVCRRQILGALVVFCIDGVRPPGGHYVGLRFDVVYGRHREASWPQAGRKCAA